MKKGFNIRFVLRTLGFVLIIESLLMMSCSLVAFYHQEVAGDAILTSCGITIVVGVLLQMLGADSTPKRTSKRESFLAVTLVWLGLAAFGMLPFYLSGTAKTMGDALFETMSGFSTTGCTILTDIDHVPKSLLLWRSITQWIGGIGIIVFALLLLPMVGGDGTSLYNSEATGIVKDKFSPKLKETVRALWMVYLLITTTLFLLLWAGPMGIFDALCHALTTVSTGGFSTKQNGVAFWDSAYIDYLLCLFMFVGGINFSLIYFALRGQVQKVFSNEEFRWYTAIILITTAISFIALLAFNYYEHPEHSFRKSLFHVISVITSTGFATADFNAWGVFFSLLMCLLMFFGACAGSTSGGVKMVRMMVLAKNAINEFKRQVHPHAVLPVRLNGSVVPMDVVTKVLAFIFLYLSIWVFSCMLLALAGMNFDDSVGAALSCLSNAGAAIGSIGADGDFSGVPDVAKWYLAFLMLVGRLEVFTVLSLFMPTFWKK